MKHWPKRSRSASAAFALAAVVAAGLALFLGLRGTGGPNGSGGSDPAPAPSQDFAALGSVHTNRCNLAAAEVRSMPGSMRLQGSCCFPMDRSGYRRQLRGLRHYTGAERRVIPADPYDVSVALAKRLLSYRAISLSSVQRELYRHAAAKSSLGGPCCCRCWRWQAFKGQARFMITRRHYSAAQMARLWELEEGCGGSET